MIGREGKDFGLQKGNIHRVRQGEPDRAAVIDDKLVAQCLGDVAIGLVKASVRSRHIRPVLYMAEK